MTQLQMVKERLHESCLALDLGMRLCHYVLFVAYFQLLYIQCIIQIQYIHTTLYNFINNSSLYFVFKLVSIYFQHLKTLLSPAT